MTTRSNANTHLVTLHSPDLEDASLRLEKLELFLPEEDGTAVWAVVALYVKTRRVGLREEHPAVALRAEDGLQEVEVIHFLKNPVCDVSWFNVTVLVDRL
jgi:hypothetical protein